MATVSKNKILELLKSQKDFDEKKFDAAIKTQKKKGGSLGKILIESGIITQKDFMIFLGTQLNIPPVNLSRYKLDPELLEIFTESVIRDYKVIPISKIGDILTVAVSDPLDALILDKLKATTGHKIEMVLSTEDEIKTTIDHFYSGRGFDFKKTVDEMSESGIGLVELRDAQTAEQLEISQIIDKVKLPPIIKIVNLILIEALKKRASDIHIEPTEKLLRVRYRIDGVLHDSLTLPKKSQNAIIARVKILSNLEITQSNLPQDGSFKVKIEGKEIDFRVSVLPTANGSKVVLRLLDRTKLSVGLGDLGFLPEAEELFNKSILKPYGIILVTGPTGSGKSTTLYSVLNQLNTTDKSIITLEDPVEYQLEGITQIQIRPDIELTFASGLRSLLRQNPDVIMVGEIRDGETADIAIKASLTGQVVFSTLHTNDAPSAITRLIDMGVEPFLIASSLVFIAAQRLCRKICHSCKEAYEISKQVLDRIGISEEQLKASGKTKFYHGKGCPKCNNTGFLGRMGILEALFIDDEIKTMITKRESTDTIRDYALKHGMKTLRDDAIYKFLNGWTTLEEVLTITQHE
ncbi:MAG: Flp pilus assembly complex ATPase component TadA [Candidatus Omnitrophica bacterium]|nr:Flp pilus assembly complex ATPase component TadA [Candidatus Omnitrophota bacterium]